MKHTITLFFIIFSALLAGCNNNKSLMNAKGFSLEEATIAEIHNAYTEHVMTCEDLVLMYLDRIDKLDKSTGLNSIVVINQEAISIARELDREFRKTGTLRPLHGIPVIVKDNYNTIGLQTAAGSLAMKGFEPETDSYIVKMLKDAGAIVLVKSNMAEWAFSPMVTISSIAGETLNPYNLEHVPAGSSGGTAAAVAANFGAVGIGTDTGNSIRGPSSHNALVGFRATIGLISRSGIAPLYLRNDIGGPMTRTVEDAVRILDVIAGYDPEDPVTAHSEGRVPVSYLDFLDNNGLEGARIGVLREVSDKDPDPAIDSLFTVAISDLKRLGSVIIDPCEIKGFDSLRRDQWCSTFQYDINTWLSAQGENVPVKNLKEIVASGKFSDYISDDLKWHLNFEVIPEKREQPCFDAYTDPKRTAFRNAIENVMDSLDLDAIIFPTWNNPPARVGDFDGYKGDNSQIISPHTGQPGFTVPMGYTYADLPAGLQFLGRMYDEPTLIKLCYSYEQGTKHRKPPAAFSGLTENEPR